MSSENVAKDIFEITEQIMSEFHFPPVNLPFDPLTIF
jgi:hypothetical protein